MIFLIFGFTMKNIKENQILQNFTYFFHVWFYCEKYKRKSKFLKFLYIFKFLKMSLNKNIELIIKFKPFFFLLIFFFSYFSSSKQSINIWNCEAYERKKILKKIIFFHVYCEKYKRNQNSSNFYIFLNFLK